MNTVFYQRACMMPLLRKFANVSDNFTESDRRVQLFAVLEKFVKFVADTKSAALVQAMIVNGSFTTER